MDKYFKTIYKTKFTDYKLGMVDNVAYLRVVSFEDVPLTRVTMFGRIKTKIKKTITNDVLIPLTASVHVAMLNTLKLRKISEDDFEGDIINIYQVIDEVRHKEAMDEFRKIIDISDDKGRYKTPITPKNKVASGFKNEGYFYLGEETTNRITKIHTLYKTSKYEGFLRLVLVNEIVTNNDRTTTSVINIDLTRDVIDSIFYNMGFYEIEGEDIND